MKRNYDQKTLGLLWGKSGGICAYPECENELIIKDLDEIVGHICHIVGLKGPRADQNFPKDELNKYENLVLMCRHHHGIIDINLLTHTKEKLHEIKENHENLMLKRFGVGTPWKINVSQLYYLNIPRLSILSELKGHKIDLSFLKDYENLNSIGFSLGGLLNEFKTIFSQIKPNVLQESRIKEIVPELIGLTFGYGGEFRTKNNPRLDHFEEGKVRVIGDINKDPHIYKDFLGYKLILTIDPKWITTSTAFVNLRPSGGKGNFAGIATIKQIDFDNKLIMATPLLIGIPKSPLDEIFNTA